jgi:phytoene dehydrogenase-like protein
MAKLAEELGVKFIVNEEVIKIENDGDVISTVITKNGIYTQIW